MKQDITTRDMIRLNRLLSKSLPKRLKAKNLFIVFSIISTIGLAGVFLSALLIDEMHWKDISLSISSGLFASGIFATLVELMNIRNKRSFIRMKLSELKYCCEFYIDLIGVDLIGVDDSYTYREWVNLLFIEYNKDKTIFMGVLSRIDDMIKCSSFFFSDKYDGYNNPYVKDGLLFSLRRMAIMCNTAKKLIESNKIAELPVYLEKRIPSVIIGVFKDLEEHFNRCISY